MKSPCIPIAAAGALGAVLLVCLAPSAAAQTLYGIDSRGGLSNPWAVELTGPPAGMCGYPSGPMGGFPTFVAVAGGCPNPLPFAGWPALEGDIAVNDVLDTVWMAGMNEIAEYTTAGVMLTGFFVPFNVTGLAVDPATNHVWVSSVGSYRRLNPACVMPALDIGPFPNPLPGQLTDIDWDPMSNTLWGCTSIGTIGNFPPGAAGPTCSFTTFGIGLAAPLTGIALDLTTPGVASPHRVLCVTNGMNIARIDVQASCAAGAAILEPASFAFPTNPFSVTGGPLSGLAFSGHGVKFGAVTGPVAQLTGSEIIGAATAVTMTGAAPGAALVFSGAGGALCPPMPGPGGVMLVVAPTFVAGPYAHLGTLSLPVVIPAGAAAGTPTFLQFINQKTAGGFEATQGLLMTTSRP